MGTTGTGRLGDYQGGEDTEDRCDRALTTSLEDVPTLAYHQAHKQVPPPKTPVRLAFNQRLVVVADASGEEIGYLPTQFNYLRACMLKGREYAGQVLASADVPFATVNVDLAPLEK